MTIYLCDLLIVLSLMFQYRSNFPSFIKELAVFVDLAPRFQMMAEEVLQRQIQLVIVNLKQVSSIYIIMNLSLQLPIMYSQSMIPLSLGH